MRAIGLAVDMPKPARPVVHFVVLDDPHGAADAAALADVTSFDAFPLKTAEAQWSQMTSQFFQEVSARVSTLSPDVIVVRRADVFRKGRVGDGPRLRLVVEGAITAAAMSHLPGNTHLRTGADCATKYGKSKDEMDADASSLATHKNYVEAVAAALSGLFGNRT
jgi:hypothetical protein